MSQYAERQRPRILTADDDADHLELIRRSLQALEFDVVTASDGEEALARFRETSPDLVLLDFSMPKMTGPDVCRYIKSASHRFVPVVLVTGDTTGDAKQRGYEAGADDYLAKPIDAMELRTRCAAMLRIKMLQDQVEESRLQLEAMIRDLQYRMQLQMIELERLSRLRRHVVPAVTEMAVEDSRTGVPRRKDITIVFSDIRNFTQMSDQLDPEDVKLILDEYLTQMTDVVFRNGGTVNKFVGDGVMFFFGDSTPQPDHALRGLRAALDMRDRARVLSGRLHDRLPEPFTVGLGVHTGPATVGNLGNWQQLEYTAVGSSVNLAARLQGLSKNSEVIASAATYGPLRDQIEIRNERREQVRGFAHPIQVAEVMELRAAI